MMRWVEDRGGRVPNVFPLRNSIVPKYIRLDTTLVIQLLLSKTSGLGAKYKLLKDIIGNKDAVWRSVFHLERKCFAPQESNKYEFAHTMQTDGIACSLLWNEKGAGAEKKKRLARKRELLALPKDLKRVRPEPSAKRAELYVAPTGSSKRVVGVDPGKSDLISSGTGPGDWFRYTQKRHETGEKKHRRARTKMARTLVEGKTVVDWETELSTFSRKALTVSAAEAWGDWSRGSQMKFLEPTKGVGMRKLFSRAGYEVVLVDEFRTSCTCFACEGGACEKFRVVENPRPWMRAKRPMVLRHGLLRCKTCERLWNRDRNGSLNIMRCAQAARLGGQRPSYMTRNFSAARPAGTTQGAGLPTMAMFI
ncbi:hypothetical protein BASA81_009825 [Batrachochytrium salamandrivorans]|nr:hypothetical protein BASA81_009825 [Batrachochytrium salamandrivorans]